MDNDNNKNNYRNKFFLSYFIATFQKCAPLFIVFQFVDQSKLLPFHLYWACLLFIHLLFILLDSLLIEHTDFAYLWAFSFFVELKLFKASSSNFATSCFFPKLYSPLFTSILILLSVLFNNDSG